MILKKTKAARTAPDSTHPAPKPAGRNGPKTSRKAANPHHSATSKRVSSNSQAPAAKQKPTTARPARTGTHAKPMATKTTHTTKHQAASALTKKKTPPQAAPSPLASARNHAATRENPVPVIELTEEQLRAMPESDYMNPAQLAFFRARLLAMREEVLDREIDAKERLVERENFADPADRATAEENHWLDLRLRERESRLLGKIDAALQLIRTGEYGYCQKTGEPIGIPRLLARPTATVCVDVKDQSEKIETHFRDN